MKNPKTPMKVTILDGSLKADSTANRVQKFLLKILKDQGWHVEHILVREKLIGHCAGDFFCWVRNPGVCIIDDDNRLIAESIANSHLLVLLTPITFGGYSSTLKRAVDHMIQNISPFFTQINGETHHQKRYQNYPDYLAIGWMDKPDAQVESIFRTLTWRNALNFHAEKAATSILLASQTDQEIDANIHHSLVNMPKLTDIQPLQLPQTKEPTLPTKKIENAVLLVGSPRNQKSTSYALGSTLFKRLEGHHITTQTINIYTSIRASDRIQDMLNAVNAADLVVLSFPLYVDSLPAPTIEALEHIAASRSNKMSSQRFAAIANCGFPEPHHNAAALAICKTFAHQAGFLWAGSLSLGAGQGMVHGTSLDELGGRAVPLRKALTLAADALASGQSIPEEAQVLWDKPFIPGWLYRAMGQFGWRQQAKKYGAEKQLNKRVYVKKVFP